MYIFYFTYPISMLYQIVRHQHKDCELQITENHSQERNDHTLKSTENILDYKLISTYNYPSHSELPTLWTCTHCQVAALYHLEITKLYSGGL